MLTAQRARRDRAWVSQSGDRWRGWRRGRPFAGALLAIAGGGEIAAVRLALPVRDPDTIVPAGLLIAAGIILCGMLLLADPIQRSGYATAVILLAIAALATAHLGGYLAGAVMGAGGGAVAFAWVPGLSARAVEDSARDGSAYEGDASDGGAYDGGAYDGGAYDGGAYDGGAYDGGASDGGASEHGASEHGASEHGASEHGASEHGASDGSHGGEDGGGRPG